MTEGEIKGTLLLTVFLYIIIEPQLPHHLPSDAFLHGFWSNNWNSAIYVAARGAIFLVTHKFAQ
jgi:hypothetical protein